MSYALVRNATEIDQVQHVGQFRIVGIWPPLPKNASWRVFVVQGYVPSKPVSKKIAGRRVLVEPVDASHPLLVALGIGQSGETYETPGGRVLNDDDIHELSVEAEIGYVGDRDGR